MREASPVLGGGLVASTHDWKRKDSRIQSVGELDSMYHRVNFSRFLACYIVWFVAGSPYQGHENREPKVKAYSPGIFDLTEQAYIVPNLPIVYGKNP